MPATTTAGRDRGLLDGDRVNRARRRLSSVPSRVSAPFAR
jgi:hypothetical protein